ASPCKASSRASRRHRAGSTGQVVRSTPTATTSAASWAETHVASALDDLRVIEMGQLLAGPFCGQLLADFGADVIKMEPPGDGDPMREWGREKSGGQSLWWPVVG